MSYRVEGFRMVQAAVNGWRRVDVLVNAAGTTKFVEHADHGGLDADIFLASPMAVLSMRALALRDRFLV